MKTFELIVPCFNESESIELFYDKVAPILSSLEEFEASFIFVDDGSSDDTMKKITELAEKDDSVKYISFSRNFGKEGAMLAGLSYSTADYVGIIDADLQHNPALISEMLGCVSSGEYDVAAACRAERKEKGVKSMLSSAFYKVSNSMTEIEMQQNAQDYRIMKRNVVDTIVALSEKNRFTKGIFSFVGFKTKWFPQEDIERVAGETKWNIRKLFKYALNGILAYSDSPLRFPLYCGLIFIILGFFLGIACLVIEFCTGYTVSLALFLSVLASLGFGLVLLSVGITGEYIARIYTEVKNRPVFIVRETNIDKE